VAKARKKQIAPSKSTKRTQKQKAKTNNERMCEIFYFILYFLYLCFFVVVRFSSSVLLLVVNAIKCLLAPSDRASLSRKRWALFHS